MRLSAASMVTLVWMVVLMAIDGRASHEPIRKLRVCADPNNLPFSNDKRDGFENKITELIARDLHAKVEYVWWAQRRGYIRNTLNAGMCDVIPGVATSVDMLATTRPYYRSSYVFVSRRDKGARSIHSFDSPELRKLKIGVQIIGDDYTNTPPVHALAQRNLAANIRGYRVVGDYSQPNPPARIIEAVAKGEVDLAVVWGPLAGYFAKREKAPLQVVPVPANQSSLPLTYDISMGVRRSDKALRDDLNKALERNRAAIQSILQRYGVPQPKP